MLASIVVGPAALSHVQHAALPSVITRKLRAQTCSSGMAVSAAWERDIWGHEKRLENADVGSEERGEIRMYGSPNSNQGTRRIPPNHAAFGRGAQSAELTIFLCCYVGTTGEVSP